MKKRAGEIVFSPSDLIVFLDSPFASWMDRLVLEHPEQAPAPAPEDAESALVKRKGDEHERRFLATLRAEGRDVVEVARGEGAGEATVAAMRAGREVIYQGALRGTLEGFSDFLVRVSGASALGDWHYEVWDTKLAARPKPYFVLQLCAYAEMLEATQGLRPREIAIVLGTDERRRLRTDDFFFYYREVKRTFLEFHASFDATRRPLPQARADHRHWTGLAESILEERDDLSRVAGLTRVQARRLAEAGIGNLRALAESRLERVAKLDPAVLARLAAQARLQCASAGKARPEFELVPPDPERPRSGLALLPPPSALDVFFDMEGYPFDGGLEYLFGACYFEGGTLVFRDLWARDSESEKRAFEAFVDWSMDRLRRDPTMHIYHYAAYEVTALRRLSTRHATREDEVDGLLRGEAFVDLYPIVRHAVRVGEPAYSLKNVERLYREARAGDVTTAGGSVVEYDRWLEARDGESWQDSAILRGIRDYNREDCESTAELVGWLRARQRDARLEWIAPVRSAKELEKQAAGSKVTPASELARRLLSSMPEDRDDDRERWRIQEILAHLLEFHRRELKPTWWRMFDRHAMSDEELIDDLDCLGSLERTETPPQRIKKSLLYEYRFDPDQDTKLAAKDKCYYAHDLTQKAEIETLDRDRGLVTIRLGPTRAEPPRHLSLIPDEYVSPDVIAESIYRTVSRYEATGALPRALEHFLRRAKPSTVSLDEIENLPGETLCIQGPPGSGKTYTAARLILRLLANGLRVGITSNSHKAVLKLMEEVFVAAREKRSRVSAVKVGGDGDEDVLEQHVIAHVESVRDVDFGPAGPRLVGGTAWAFSAIEAVGQFDFLFIDEAGQVSIANLAGMAPAARNVVLVGDQMQLGQPTQGAHPGESGLSTLEYLLQGHATIPPDMGVFLETTRRLHPDVCSFISGAIYEDRLRPHPCTAKRLVCLPPDGGRRIHVEAGIVFVPVEHEDNAQASDEEVGVIQGIVAELVGRPFTDKDGVEAGQISLADILLVAPYNMQVRRLKDALGPAAHVGSVDKFQGQEAPIVILSMCASAGDSARGIDFLFNPNRINVAISRAQSLAIVIGSPHLARTRCASVEQMRLVNLFCRALQTGSAVTLLRPLSVDRV